MEHVQGDRKASANFRHVCHVWREAHDRLLTVLEPKGAPPDARVWKKFGGVKVMDLQKSLVHNNDVRALTLLTWLTSLNLHGCIELTDEGVRMLAPLTATISPPRCSSKWTGGIVSSARERVLNKATRWVAYTWRSPSTRC
jgi:hypothetical protein